MIDTAIALDAAVSNRRRSQRVFLEVRVVARFHLLEHEWVVDGDTVVVNAHGGTVRLSVAPLLPGDIITLTNPATDQAEHCRVVRIELSNADPEKSFEIAFAFHRPSPNFWAVAFPPTDWIESVIEH